MGIDINREELISLAEVSRAVPGRPALSTIWRWRLKGVRNVRLETVVVGGRVYSSRQAVERFIAATTAVSSRQPGDASSSRERLKARHAAEDFLDSVGIEVRA
jgi:hypothetical protein